MIEAFVLATGTLFPIMNPLSTAFVFNSLASHKSKNERRKIAIRSTVAACVTLLTFMILGSYLLNFFGITIYAFRVAGGLYMGKVGFEMLGSDLRRNPDTYDEDDSDISIIPLAIPLISGPGALTAVLVLTEVGSLSNYLIVALAIIVMCVVAWLLLRHAHYLTRVFGRVGTKAMERILGLIVLVIAVQFFFNGVSGYLVEIGFSFLK